jgi:hypothetical protein
MRKENILVVVSAVLLTLLALAPVAYKAYQGMPPKVAQVDLQKIVEEEQMQSIAVMETGGSLTDEQRAIIERRTVHFAKTLSSQIAQLGDECRCVIVNKAAVLGGSVVDYTDQIRQRMKQ